VDLSLVRETQPAREAAVTALVVVLLAAGAATAPAVLEQVEADYPAFARGAGLSTTVTLRVRVTAEGLPARIRVVPYSTRHDVLPRSLRASFDSAAVRAVRRWRFRPATENGRPVAGWIQVEVPFEESWTQTADPHAVMPDSIRSGALWNTLMGEWWRVPIRRTPVGHPSAFRFQPGGQYLLVDATGGEKPGRFEVNGSPEDPDAVLVLLPDSASRRPFRIRFAGRDTLILCPWKPTSACDTFVTVARGTGR
jgi:TonB family protein